jgi:hypothetical protein
MTEAQWISKVLQTRYHGSVYIPVASRDGLTVGDVRYSWTYYGRSGQGGGHKHKAYAHDAAGRPVPSKVLRARKAG